MIRAKDVSVNFSRGLFRSRFKALDAFSLTIEKGDIFALLGPNGAGKSTAMYCFLGLIQPDNGYLSVLGRKPTPGGPHLREVVYLPEEPHYHLYLTVGDAVGYYARLQGTPVGKKKVHDALERLGLSEFRDLRLALCSKGMKQKVGIAQCLISNPKLLFLDEPTRGLDPIMVREFREILTELSRQGSTIVLNSHVLSEIEMICNRAAIIDRGKVIAQDDMNRLRGVGLERYQVEFDLIDPVPEYVVVSVKSSTTIKGEIPVDKLGEFVRSFEGSGRRMYECSLKRQTLEDSYFKILKGKSGD